MCCRMSAPKSAVARAHRLRPANGICAYTETGLARGTIARILSDRSGSCRVSACRWADYLRFSNATETKEFLDVIRSIAHSGNGHDQDVFQPSKDENRTFRPLETGLPPTAPPRAQLVGI